MVSYYNLVEGDLYTGGTAKSSDINHIQTHIQDAIKKAISDHHDGESYLLGAGEYHKNDFIVTAAPQFLGRYMDSYHIFECDKEKYININRYDVKQPFILTKTSVYSIITKLKNTSNRDISVDFEIQDANGNFVRGNTITIPKETEEGEFEIVFDIDYYPTIHNTNFEDVVSNDSKEVSVITKEESYDTGYSQEHENENENTEFTAGASILYFVIKRTNLNEIDLISPNEETIFDPEHSLGVFYSETSPSSDKDIYAQINGGTAYEKTGKNIYLQEVYSNEPTYLCTGGTAIVGGEKVECIDTHVTLAGSSEYGNVLSHIYLGNDGHLYSNNSKASTTTNIDEFEEDLDDRNPAVGYRIASILTYSNTLGYDKEPLVIQSNTPGVRNLSHHERLRRLENKIDWTMDKALPSRIKYTLSGNDWFDSEYGNKINYPYGAKPEEMEAIGTHYTSSFDSQGNAILRLSDSKTETLTVTLKDITKMKKDSVNDKSTSSFAEIKNMNHDKKKGILTLADGKRRYVAYNEKEAKATKYNLWDDYAGNRAKLWKEKGKEIYATTRKYTVISGRNGEDDRSSSYPAMTFYTDSKIKIKKLEIPITKFENCSGMKFFIYKRQEENNKENTVWVETPAKWQSKEMSLKKAKTKGNRQYLDEGFTLDFDKGLSLERGQYIILCLPIPKGDSGSCWVRTYKPRNPKDFCIRYIGNSNASHFRLDDRYPEIWYNSAKATVEVEQYKDKGHVVSKTSNWFASGQGTLLPFKTVKPVLSKNLHLDKGSSYKLYVDTGGGWQEVKANKSNPVTGGGQTFKWKLEFNSGKNGKGTPKLKYDKKDGYAMKFILTREAGGYTRNSEIEKYNNTICLNSKIFDGDDILRQYIGDPNLGIEDSKFSQYEFGRIWAEKEENKDLLIDIQGADRDMTLNNVKVGDSTETIKFPYWTYHYCDLTLDDFAQTSVDYDDYSQEIEYDENNLRFKLDPNHSYNDNDIAISSLANFKHYKNDIDAEESEDSKTMTFINKSSVKKNQLYMKNTLEGEKTIDLTKYTGLRLNFKVRSGTNLTTLKGLAIYISSTEEPLTYNGENNVPSAIRNDPENMMVLTNEESLMSELSEDSDILSHYKDEKTGEMKVIKYNYEITTEDGDKCFEPGYFHYVAQYDSTTNKIVYKLEQIHDYRSYNIYYLPEIKYDESKATTKDSDKWTVFSARIELDEDSQNLKYAKEIGIISVHDDKDFPYEVKVEGSTSTTTTNDDEEPVDDPSSLTLELDTVRAISEDYYPVFKPENHTFKAEDYCDTFGGKALPFEEKPLSNTDTNYQKYYGPYNIPRNSSNTKSIKISETDPITNMISIKHKELPTKSETLLCYFNNPYDLSNYKHLGIQIAFDVYIPKDCFKICLCKQPNGREEIATINIPTLNGMYFPYDTLKEIHLSQLFKKIDSKSTIKSISIKATKNCKEILCGDTEKNNIVDKDKPRVNMFIGNIVLYKAETIPFYHRRLRYKLYNYKDGAIAHVDDGMKDSDVAIRKIGIVADYK